MTDYKNYYNDVQSEDAKKKKIIREILNKYKIDYIREALIQHYKDFDEIEYKNVNVENIEYISSNKYISSYYINNKNKSLAKEDKSDNFYKLNIFYDKNGNTVYRNDKKCYENKKHIQINFVEKPLTGLPNIGNSCYMNSFLQILFHTPKFLHFLYKYNCQSLHKNCLIYNICYLSKYPYNEIYLNGIKSIMGEINGKYKTFTPGDSQHFAIDFLSQLNSELSSHNYSGDSDESNYDKGLSKKVIYKKFCKNYHNKKDIVEQLFQFSEIKKSKTYMHKYNFSIYFQIELCFPIKYTNEINLTTLLDNKYSLLDDVLKDVKPKLADLPEILIITFVRGIEGKELIKTKVSFGETLILDKYLDLELAKKYKNRKYILYGINERYGDYKSQGHYYCYIKIYNNKIYNKQWYRFSDLNVTDCSPDFCSPDVFGLYYIRDDCIN